VQTIEDLAAYLREHCADAVRRRYPDEACAARAGEGSAAESARQTRADRGSIPRLARDDEAEKLLSQLDELSDDEIELLLAKAASDEEIEHE
jgi:hypothetical protein